jgi:hypothetical protein
VPAALTDDQLDHAEVIRRIEFGIDVEHALGKPIVQFLITKADAEREDALAQLATLNPYSEAAKIVEVQSRLRALWLWQDWMAEAIVVGQSAQQQLIESESQPG